MNAQSTLLARVGLVAMCLSLAVAAPVMAQVQDYGLSGPAQIETETLGAAQDFDAGMLKNGALDAGLWQGTSASRAAQLLSTAPLKNTDPIIRNIVRTVLLSGGVPPQANGAEGAQAYEAARLQAVLAIESGGSGDAATLDGFLARNPELARAPLAQVDLALSKGDWQRGCEISDTITTDRSKPEWARLRVACHALRGEMSAADVTRDMLRSSGYDNPAYHAQLDALLAGSGPAPQQDQADALVTFMATRAEVTTETSEASVGGRASDLAALFKSFSGTDLPQIENVLGTISFDAALPDLDLKAAMTNPSARATGRLFVLGRSGDAAALDTFITRAVRAGVSENVVLNKLAPLIQALSATERMSANLPRYTRAAVMSRDIGSLQQLYTALPQGSEQARIALIADALGGGFSGQSLGRDIEGRLSTPMQRSQAVKDAQIALALGATLSDAAADALSEAFIPQLTLPQGKLLMLDAAVRANSRAETSLRAASLLARPGLNTSDKAKIVSALTQAGLPKFAGQIAADVFFEALTTTP